MTLPLPDPLVAVRADSPLLGEDQDHRVSPWGVQRNFETLAQRFPLGPSSENFQQVPQARVYHNAAQSIANTTFTALAFNSERWDLGTPSLNMHDTATDNGRLTCRVAGLYSIGVAVYWASAGGRMVKLRVGGATDIAINEATSGAIGQTVCTDYRLAVDDYVDVVVWQNSGGALNVSAGGNYSPEFWMHWVSP